MSDKMPSSTHIIFIIFSFEQNLYLSDNLTLDAMEKHENYYVEYSKIFHSD